MSQNLPVLKNGKPHVSYSEFSTWMKCSYRHLLSYVLKVGKQLPSFALIYGNAQHDYLESFVTKRDDSVAREICRQRLQAWRTENDAWFMENVEKVPELQKFDIEALVEKISEIGQLSIEFLDRTFKNWQILRAEDELYEPAHSNGGKEFRFKGFVDLVIVADSKKKPSKKNPEQKKEVWLLDWKTTSRPWDAKKLRDPIVTYQLVLYKKFWLQKVVDLGIDAKEIRCGYITILRESKKKNFYTFIPVSVGPVPTARAQKQIGDFIASMERGTALKRRSESNCRFCEFAETSACPSVLQLNGGRPKDKSPPHL